ncbi:PKD domain-containing protein [candidate division KSB1 bacterium]|nr:PKD domain-containing protein [candidate division KSB1 bacterium]
MKRNLALRLLFVIFILSFNAGFLHAQTWSNPVPVSSGNTPYLDIDKKTGKVHVIAMNNGVIYTVFDANGNKLSQETVPNTIGEEGEFRFGAAISVDTLGYPHITYRRYGGDNNYDGFYIYKTAAGWSSPIQVFTNIARGYVFRVEVDSKNKVHMARGSINNDIWGPVRYYRFFNGTEEREQDDFSPYRGDDRLELASGPSNNVHMMIGCPDDWPGKVTYYRSTDGGTNWSEIGNIIHADAGGRTGSPDVFVDGTGALHVGYGAGQDWSKGGTPSFRYAKFVNGTKVTDVAVTDSYELSSWHHDLGIGSIAASPDGKYVVAAYLTTDGGELFARLSDDYGETWGDKTKLASTGGGSEGRNKHYIRANGYKFYLVIPYGSGPVEMRMLEVQPPVPPEADAGGPYTGVEGTAISFDASGSTDNVGISTYEWDWNNDGTFDQSTATPTITHAFTDDYSGEVLLRCTNTMGLKDMATAIVTVTNANPVADAGDAKTGNEGAAISFTVTVTDPGTADTHTASWNFNDGSTAASGLSVSHTFADNGTYNVVVTVTDDDGGTATDNVSVTVNNVNPVAEAGGPYSGNINMNIPVTGDVTDAGTADTHTYEWDLDNNGSFEKSGKTVNAVFTSIGQHTVSLRVTDDDGGQGTDTATITTYNNAPQISTIANQTVNEGQSFTAIQLDNYGSDPNNADNQLTWSVKGAVNLAASIANRVLSVSPVNPDWNGSEILTLIVKDPDQLVDSTAVTFTVNPVNDAPVFSAIPDTSFMEDDTLIVSNTYFAKFVTDVDNVPADLQFEIRNNNHLTWLVDIIAKKYFIYPQFGWNGTEVLTVRVSDGSGGTDETTWSVTVRHEQQYLDSLRVDDIPDQSVNQGTAFSQIQLDNYVTDLDFPDNQITWTYQGNVNLSVNIASRAATVAPLNPDWLGTENITFVATNPRGITDNTTVAFTVRLNNVEPTLAPVDAISFNEDETYSMPLATLLEKVTDPDTGPAALTFEIRNNTNITWTINNSSQTMDISAKQDWNGAETVKLRVTDDAGGFDEADWAITVVSVKDAPKPFSLHDPEVTFFFWPENAEFSWEESVDPDEAESPQYQFYLSSDPNFQDASKLFTTPIITDETSLTLPKIRERVEAGTYYWKVYAFSKDALFAESNEVGVIHVATGSWIAVEDQADAETPDKFALLPNHPNPFSASNSQTHITYHLKKDADVQLVIFNTLGQQVRVLKTEFERAGVHQISWDGRDAVGRQVAGGIYLCRMLVDNQVFNQKMMILQ